jgi:hypothetical protein
VTFGLFDNKNEAKKELKNLPKHIKIAKPYIRKVSQISNYSYNYVEMIDSNNSRLFTDIIQTNFLLHLATQIQNLR